MNVTNKTFDAEVRQSELPVVVDFYADWCPPCRALGPIFERLADEFAGKIKFVKVNSDDESELAEEFKVMGLPTIVFMSGGNNVGQFSGLPEEDAFRAKLTKWLESQAVA